jgi:hypothetical protein
MDGGRAGPQTLRILFATQTPKDVIAPIKDLFANQALG